MSHCSFIFPAILGDPSLDSAASTGLEERHNMYRRNCSAKKFMFQFDLFFCGFLLTFFFFPLMLFFETGLLGSHTLKPPPPIAVDVPEVCMISYKANLKPLTLNTSKICASKAHDPFKITSLNSWSMSSSHGILCFVPWWVVVPVFTLFMLQVQWNILKTFQHSSYNNWGIGEGRILAQSHYSGAFY